MKKLVAYAPAWVFYWVGHFISILMPYKMEFLYPVYSMFMNWSVFFNDWADLDVWAISQETNDEV